MGTQQSRPGSTNLGRNEVGAWRHGVRKVGACLILFSEDASWLLVFEFRGLFRARCSRSDKAACSFSQAHRVSNTVRKNRVPQFKVLSTVFEEEEESCEKRPAKYETLMRLLSEETERVRSYRSVGFRRRVEPQQVPSPQAQVRLFAGIQIALSTRYYMDQMSSECHTLAGNCCDFSSENLTAVPAGASNFEESSKTKTQQCSVHVGTQPVLSGSTRSSVSDNAGVNRPRRKEDMYSKTHLAQKTAIIEQQRAAVEAVLRRAAEKKEQEANMSEQEQDQ
eukprot:635099-Rhodomonas_salina.1